MRKWFFVLLVLAVLSFPVLAHAQNTSKLSSVEVDLRPEYDAPTMLVIYRVTLPSSVSLPFEMSLRIPAVAGKPNAVAARQVDNTLINLNYEQSTSGDWSELKFTATMPEIQVEYYDPRLSREGDARHYEYAWPGDYDVDKMTIQVQQPYGVSSMRTTPDLGPQVIGGDNLVYYVADLGALKIGQDFKITLDYQKFDDSLTIEHLPVMPSAPISENPGFATQISTILPYILLAIGIILILVAVVVFGFWQFGRKVPESDEPRRRRRPRREEADDAEEAFDPEPGTGLSASAGISSAAGMSSAADGAYCPKCGRRSAAGDQFCRSCGSRLRHEA